MAPTSVMIMPSAPRETRAASAPTPTPAPYAQQVLRRHGRRPLAFRGALALSRRTGAANTVLSHAFELFVTDDGDAVARLSARLVADGAVRRFEDAAVIRDADGLAAFLDAYDPDILVPTPDALWTDAPIDSQKQVWRAFARAVALVRRDFAALRKHLPLHSV